jgi:hypothetical protein
MKTLKVLYSIFIPIFLFLLLSGNSFSQDVEFSFVCPVAGSKNLQPEQNIILKYANGYDIGTISSGKIIIRGSLSGLISANLIISNDHKTIILKPLIPFQRGEMVTVIIPKGIMTSDGKSLCPYTFNFTILDYDRDEIYKQIDELNINRETDDQYQDNPKYREAGHIRDNNLPPDYPAPAIYSYGDHDNEYIFINMFCRNITLPWGNYLTILDSYGTPIYYDKNDINRINFGILPNGLLGYSTNFVNNIPEEKYYIMDSAYVVVDSVNTGNGYILDAHDMYLLSNNHYLVMSYDPQPVDMSKIVPGGDPNAIVVGFIIQEVDNNQNVFFQWRSWDHFEITDATYDINLMGPYIDYVHGNAFEIDDDGHILLSSRNLDEITKINFNTGNVIWRFGLNCENNMFNIFDDPYGFSHQHDIRKLSNGHYTIYDNGNLHNPPFTQVLEYEIDEVSLTATLVWDYHHSPQVYAAAMGSFRTQPNGERIIGWGGIFPLAVTELKTDNSLLREFHLPDYVTSYRAIKGSWETNVFETQEELSLGNYAGYTGWKENLLYIFNLSNQVIKITSTHNHLQEFYIDATFPISIFPYSYLAITVAFQPEDEGIYNDRLTLNYDNEGNTQRIARQLNLRGMFDNSIPSVFFDPSHSSTNISPDTEILISFDEPVRKAIGGEIQDNDIPQLVDLKETNFNGNEILFSGTINEEKTLITITPNLVLSENQQYYVKLKQGFIADFDGNIINLDEECYFTTGLLIGVNEEITRDIIIYPNPFNETLIVQTSGKTAKRITIFNGTGKLLFEAGSSCPEFSINMSEHSQGIYFIKISDQSSGASHVFKAIKHTPPR